jgi:L-threonylcarbamoyladenylate synthase
MQYLPDTLVIYPTDTVWGIGHAIHSKKAFEELCKIKGTGVDKPLSVLFASVGELKKYFIFPDRFGSTWLSILFGLETSVLLPVAWMREGSIPSFIYAGGPFVSVRVLSFPWIERIVRDMGAPITTTSLNLHGSAPIVSGDQAKIFYEKYAPEAVFIETGEKKLSGTPSSIVNLETCDFIREGKNAAVIREHFRLLKS